MTRNINIAIPTELHQALRQEAFDRNMTLKALIIAILSGKKFPENKCSKTYLGASKP
jgi:hypothetical protein